MAKEKFSVTLTKEERRELQKTVKCGTSPAKSILRANILLLLDENSDNKISIAKIANVLNTSTTTVMNVKKSYFEKGTQATLKRKQRQTPPVEAKITGEVEAKIIALSCGEPPDGYSRWTLRLLADKSVELGIITDVSHASVGSILKKRAKATSP
jgi:transposase